MFFSIWFYFSLIKHFRCAQRCHLAPTPKQALGGSGVFILLFQYSIIKSQFSDDFFHFLQRLSVSPEIKNFHGNTHPGDTRGFASELVYKTLGCCSPSLQSGIIGSVITGSLLLPIISASNEFGLITQLGHLIFQPSIYTILKTIAT